MLANALTGQWFSLACARKSIREEVISMYQTPSVKRLGRIEDLTGWQCMGDRIDVFLCRHEISG